jgi:hypothetical protein
MKEIKFRAWDKENKKMMKVSSLSLENKEISVKENGTFRLFRMQDLMQYTGLKDKNGKEICEGDIVKILKLEGYGESCDQVEYTAKIEYYISEFRLQLLDLRLSDESIVEIEIIGNIYENKNLLEENK